MHFRGENRFLAAWETATSVEDAENAGDSTILAHTVPQIKERKKGKERKMKLESRYRLVTGNSSVGGSGSER